MGEPILARFVRWRRSTTLLRRRWKPSSGLGTQITLTTGGSTRVCGLDVIRDVLLVGQVCGGSSRILRVPVQRRRRGRQGGGVRRAAAGPGQGAVAAGVVPRPQRVAHPPPLQSGALHDAAMYHACVHHASHASYCVRRISCCSEKNAACVGRFTLQLTLLEPSGGGRTLATASSTWCAASPTSPWCFCIPRRRVSRQLRWPRCVCSPPRPRPATTLLRERTASLDNNQWEVGQRRNRYVLSGWAGRATRGQVYLRVADERQQHRSGAGGP